jgi:hypothetical protein
MSATVIVTAAADVTYFFRPELSHVFPLEWPCDLYIYVHIQLSQGFYHREMAAMLEIDAKLEKWMEILTRKYPCYVVIVTSGDYQLMF